jgi:hypothetical protein
MVWGAACVGANGLRLGWWAPDRGRGEFAVVRVSFVGWRRHARCAVRVERWASMGSHLPFLGWSRLVDQTRLAAVRFLSETSATSQFLTGSPVFIP